MHGHGAPAALRLPEQEYQRHADQTQERQPAKCIDIGEEGSLLLQRAVQQAIGLLLGTCRVAILAEHPGSRLQMLLKFRLVRAKMADHQCLVGLAPRATMVVAMAMPMLPPILRIKLKTPAALPICSFGKAPMLVMVSGTKIRPMAKPEKTLGHITFLVAISRLIFPKALTCVGQDEESQPDQEPLVDSATNAPTNNNEQTAPMLRGLRAMPLLRAG